MTDRLNALESRIEDLEKKLSQPKIMTPREVCTMIGISEELFYEWKRKGDVPPAMYFSQRTVRYDRDEVLAWAKTKEVGAGV